MERRFRPREIFVTKKTARIPLTGETVSQFPDAEVTEVDRVTDLRSRIPPSRTEAIGWGKHVLVINDTRAEFVSQFTNPDPGSVCPRFWKFVAAMNCPLNCHMCYLQLTYRELWPWVNVYTDIPGILHQVDKAVDKHASPDRPLVLNTGELADSIKTLGIVPGLHQELVEHFAALDAARLLLLTKSAEVSHLLDLDHSTHTIMSWSINCQAVVEGVEWDTASLDDRLLAAGICQEAGYPVRLRYDPLIPIEGWREQYADMVERTFMVVRPERVTLGSYRVQGGLPAIIAVRSPDSAILELELEREGKRGRYPHAVRREMYEFVIGEIRRHDPRVPISICKETHRMWADLKPQLTSRACNCLP
jgi:spore photoproduct lyase